MPQILGIAALIAAGGFFLDKTGEGVNDASTGLVKIALAGAVLFWVGKKTKVI